MKFAGTFETALQKGEYPQEWLASAISYRQLKKCIKRAQGELRSLGLDPETLRRLWEHVGEGTRDCMSGDDDTVSTNLSGFRPRLTIAVDPRSGSPVDAWLSPQTRRYLQNLARDQQKEATRSAVILDGAEAGVERPKTSSYEVVGGCADEVETVEIPLTSNANFFQLLGRELDSLDRLQESEHNDLRHQIVKLGQRLNGLADSSTRKSKKEIHAWREVFRLYTESQIFFSSNEHDAGSMNSQQASARLSTFAKALKNESQKSLKLGKSGREALDGFMSINMNLLRFMKFQEINRTALSKITKKFDKRTALRVRTLLPNALARSPFMVQDLAKAACFTISKEVLAVLPQLDDYLCPICFSISFKPIRLRCKHVFCIRCLVVMQRARQDHCPLCREEVVMEASKCKPLLLSFLQLRSNLSK